MWQNQEKHGNMRNTVNFRRKIEMKWSKKGILSAFLIMGITCLLCGCNFFGGQRQEKETQTSETENGEVLEEKGPKIGISIYRYDDTFMKLYRSELKQYLEETYHAEVVMRNAGGNQEVQNQQVSQFIADGCKGIIVNPVNTNVAGNLADAANKAKIPLLFINRVPKETEQLRWKEKQMAVSSVGTDSRQAGTYQGEIVLETPKKGDLNGDGIISYVMLKGEPGNEDSDFRSEFAIKALFEGGMKAEMLYEANGDWSRENGKKQAKEAFAQYGKQIEVIFCGNDAIAMGAMEAAKEAGYVPGKDIYLVGVDALQETVRAIQSGEIVGTVLNDHQGQAKLAADTLVNMINGEEADTKYLVDYIKITTVDKFKELEGEE
jgi:methyl-galactoside transport system substrate-binding protein